MNSEAQTVYCLDTSAFVVFHRYYPQKRVPDLWDLLNDLVKEGKLISHDYVLDELAPGKGKSVDDVGLWADGRKHIFHGITQRQTELVPEVLQQFPKLIDPATEKNQADPWLVAMLREKAEETNLFGPASDHVLVTAENQASSVKLPAACRHFDIRCINWLDFFEMNGFQISMRKA